MFGVCDFANLGCHLDEYIQSCYFLNLILVADRCGSMSDPYQFTQWDRLNFSFVLTKQVRVYCHPCWNTVPKHASWKSRERAPMFRENDSFYRKQHTKQRRLSPVLPTISIRLIRNFQQNLYIFFLLFYHYQEELTKETLNL